MILATKYTDLDTCPLRVAAFILERLIENSLITMTALEGAVETKIGESARLNFVAALSFLFLIGLLEYDLDSDIVSLTELV